MNRTMSAQPESSGPSITLADIYYTLFRHKWKILVLTAFGLGLGAAIYYTAPKVYRSNARLVIRYIQEEKMVGTSDQIKTPGGRGDTSIASEIAILKSLDVSKIVADAVGPEKVLGDAKPENPRMAAAAIINGGLDVVVPRGSTVMDITFDHKNLAVVQPVLTEIIAAYLKQHQLIHRPGANFDDTFVQQTENLRARLAAIDEELLRTHKNLGITSLESARSYTGESINNLMREIGSAQVELAARQAVYKRLVEETQGQGAALSTEEKVGDAPVGIDPASLPVEKYRGVVERYALLKRRQQELSLSFTDASPRVKAINQQVADLEAEKKKMETEFPGLIAVAPTPTIPGQPASPAGTINLSLERAQISGLSVRIEALKALLAQVKADSALLDNAENAIQELERRKKRDEANYTLLSTGLEQARLREALSAGRISGISEVQSPTPPTRVVGNTSKIAAGVAAGGFFLGIVWAFIIELFLDRTIKRPSDIRRHAHLNLFLSIPAPRKRPLFGRATHRPVAALKASADGKTSEVSGSESGNTSTALAPWSPDDELQPYYAALRDRLIGFFESENLTHKPKLVALAGVGRNSGDASVAAGLAGSLSETEGGNVLFVDMTTGQGSAQQFFKGKAVGNIDDALSSKDSAQVQNNLFVVSEVGKGNHLPRALPMRFNHLIPKLKASDFDYIIFNMPPVSPISVTPRLASFMDIVLLVVESEKTDRDLVNHAKELLAESKTTVGAVLNKTKPYVPQLLQQVFASLD